VPLTPIAVDEKDLRASTTAYPGTMVVYTAAKTTGLPKRTAQEVAQFIRVSSTEGQVPGRGNGRLPGGYLPITKTGVTARLYAQAQAAAKVIAAQKAPTTPTPSSTPTPKAKPTGSASVAPPPATPPAAAPTPVATAAPSATTVTDAAPMVRTAAVTSGLGGGLLPVLIVVGLLCGAITLGGRVWLFLRGAR
jgi:hypothetical protein